MSRCLTCAMVGNVLCLLGETGGAFVCAERFIDTVDICQGKVSKHTALQIHTLLANDRLCRYGRLTALCTMQETCHGDID